MKRLLFALTLLVCGAAYAATGTANPTYNMNTRTTTGHIDDHEYFLFNLPSLGGGTITAATVTINVNTSSGTAVSTSAYVSETVGWNESSTYSTLSAITALGAATQTVSVSSTGSKVFDVLGTTNGIKQCYADSKTQATVWLQGPVQSGSGASAANFTIGDDSADYFKADMRTGGTPPVLTITYTPAAGGRRLQRISVNGHY